MNTLKKTLALMAALAMTTAFASCGGDDSSTNSGSSSSSSSSNSSSEKKDEATEAAEENTEAAEGDTEAAEGDTEAAEGDTEAAEGDSDSSSSGSASTELGEVTLGTGGDKFSVAAWNSDDVPALLELWESETGTSADIVNFTDFGVGGGQASEKYDALFASGDDLDVYFCEADWALKYINDDTKTAPLEALGFSDDNFADAYAYTAEIGRATSGANEGKMVGASWQAAAGGFAYRADLAEEYLGVTSPEEMQAKIGSWDDFVATATEIAEASEGKVALADSLGGMWQVFAANRTQPWVSDGSLTIDESCETFANYAKTLWDNGGVTHNSQWSDAWVPAGKDGSAMGYFVSTWGFGEQAFFGQASSDSYGSWKVVQGPQPYFWGGTWIVVNPATDNAEEAQTFIYTATVNPESMKKFALDKPEYVNNTKVMQEIIDEGATPNEYVTKDLDGQNYFAELHENAKSIDIKGLITPYDATVKQAFLDAVQKEYCEGGASWEDTQMKTLEEVYKTIPELAQ